MQQRAEKIKIIGTSSASKKLQRIVVNTSLGFNIVEIHNIIRLRADNNYTKVFLADGKQMIVSKTLKDFENALRGNFFVRVHRSDIINLCFLKEYMNNGNIILTDGSVINISRRKYKDFVNVLKKYLYHL